MGFSTLWTSLNYLQVVDQDKINVSQQLHKSQEVHVQTKSDPALVPVLGDPCTHSCVPLLSLLTFFSSSPTLTSANPCSAGFQQTAFPADGHRGCRRNARRIRLSCFISRSLGQIPNLCQFLVASNCCSLWGTDVVSSVASVQPPETSAEENSAHYMELEFRLNRWHCFFSHLTMAGIVNSNVGTWHKILSLCTKPCAALFTLQPPGMEPRSSSKNWLEKLFPACVLTEEMARLCHTGHASTRLLLHCGSSQAQLKLLKNGIKSIFPNFLC